uniref:Cyclin-dependent kinase 2-associated protein n=1 Tax=Tetranychus urticae TaxID=32264 RepID=T1K5L2_TETUR
MDMNNPSSSQIAKTDNEPRESEENSENIGENVEANDSEVNSEDNGARSNLFGLYQPTFLEGGPPTLVALPTNLPLYPNSSSFAWMRNKLPADLQVDYFEQLRLLLEEMGKDIRPVYAGNRNSAERLRRGVVQARLLIAECISQLMENQDPSNPLHR